MTAHLDEGTLQALADGETPSADAALRLHLEGCAPCAEQLEEQRQRWTTFTAAVELLDRPAPVERARDAVRGSRIRGRTNTAGQWNRPALRRAAVLLLVAGGVLYAVVPGSALNAWAGDVWERVAAPAPPTAPVGPVAPPASPAPAAPGPAGVSVLAGPDGTDVVLSAAPELLRVRLREGDRVTVEVQGAGPGLRFRTATGRVEVSGIGGAEVRVALPRIGVSTIRAGGRTYLVQDGTELTFPGPRADRAGEEIVFELPPR